MCLVSYRRTWDGTQGPETALPGAVSSRYVVIAERGTLVCDNYRLLCPSHIKRNRATECPLSRTLVGSLILCPVAAERHDIIAAARKRIVDHHGHVLPLGKVNIRFDPPWAPQDSIPF